MSLGYPNQNGGRTTDVALFHAIGNIFTGSSVSGFKVRQGSPLGMSVRVGGESNIPDDLLVKDASGATFPVCNLSTQPVVATVATANSANPRIDSVVVYIDTAVSASQTSANNQNRTKVAVVAGTPATSPSAPSASQIKAAVGSSSPYVVLADIRVNRGVTSISDTNITDRRETVRLNHAPVISDSAQLADDIVLPQHIKKASFQLPQENGWNVHINPVNGKKRYWREGNIQSGPINNNGFQYLDTGIHFPSGTRVVSTAVRVTDQSISATAQATGKVSFCVQSHYQGARAHVYWYYELEQV